MDKAQTKMFSRMIELDLHIKNTGGGKEILSQILADLERFRTSNPGAAPRALSQELQRLTGVYRTANASQLRFIRDQQNAKNATDHLAGSIGKLKTAWTGLLSPITAMVGLAGAEGFGFKSAVQYVDRFNRSLLSTASQFAKYGIGITTVEAKLKQLSLTTGLTQKETMELYSIYEKGFPFASLERGAKVLSNIKDVVGGDTAAMKEMLGMLQGIIDKFPELEQSITTMSAADKKILESTSRLAFFSGKLSLSEHKRFEDYILGSKKISSADDARRKDIQDQIDSINHLRQAFETVTLEIGRMLMPAIKWISDHIQSIMPAFQSWIAPLTKVALIFEGLVFSLKGLKFGKEILGLKNTSFFNAGGASGGAGGWSNKLVGTALNSPSFYGNALKGGGAGLLAGLATDYGYEALTGKELSKDYGGRAYGGQVVKTGAEIGAGFAAGGIPGATLAGLINIAENIYHIIEAWRGESATKAEAAETNNRSSQMADQMVRSLEQSLANAKTQEQKQKIQMQLEAAKLNASGMANYASGGSGDSQLKQAWQVRKYAAQQDEQEHASKISSILKSGDIKLNDSQFKDLLTTLEEAKEGNGTYQQKLSSYGISAAHAGDVGQLWDQIDSKEFGQIVRMAGRGASGVKQVDEERLENPNMGVAAEILQPAVNKTFNEAIKQMRGGDLAAAARSQQRAMDQVGATSVANTAYHAKTGDLAAVGDYGVNTSRLQSDSNFRFDDKIYESLEAGADKSKMEMENILGKARSESRELNTEEKGKYDHAAAANKTINDLLEARSKIMDQFGPQLQKLDAEYNQQNKSIQATNELLASQKEYVSAIVETAQMTGNVDPMAIIGAGKDALASLDEYNAGLKAQLELQKTQLELTQLDYDEKIKTNNAAIKTATNKGDTSEVDRLAAENQQLEFAKKQGAAIISAKADIISKAGTQAQKEKQIIDILKQQLDPYKAQVDYASALADKSETLISLYDNMGAGLQASVEMRMQASDAIGKQIAGERENLAMIDKIITEGKDSMAKNVRDEMSKNLKPGEQIDEAKVQAEASRRLISLDTQRVQKQTQIYQLMSKQAALTKVMRDGYVSAIAAMTAGSGMFNKILITQDKNLGFGIREMNVLISKTSGGMSGGKTRGGQFTPGGMDYGDMNATGYMDYSGHMSQRNPGAVNEANALYETDQRRGGTPGANNFGNGISGVPNNMGAFLGSPGYSHGGMNDLSNLNMSAYGMSGLTKGNSESGDKYQIKVAGGEAIINRSQYPQIAYGLGMSTQEFEEMVRSKDYSRAIKGRDGSFADGGVVGVDNLMAQRADISKQMGQLGVEFNKIARQKGGRFFGSSRKDSTMDKAQSMQINDSGYVDTSLMEGWTESTRVENSKKMTHLRVKYNEQQKLYDEITKKINTISETDNNNKMSETLASNQSSLDQQMGKPQQKFQQFIGNSLRSGVDMFGHGVDKLKQQSSAIQKTKFDDSMAANDKWRHDILAKSKETTQMAGLSTPMQHHNAAKKNAVSAGMPSFSEWQHSKHPELTTVFDNWKKNRKPEQSMIPHFASNEVTHSQPTGRRGSSPMTGQTSGEISGGISGTNSSSAPAIINLSNVTLKVENIEKLNSTFVAKLESELNKVLKQMSGGGKSSLPRSTA